MTTIPVNINKKAIQVQTIKIPVSGTVTKLSSAKPVGPVTGIGTVSPAPTRASASPAPASSHPARHSSGSNPATHATAAGGGHSRNSQGHSTPQTGPWSTSHGAAFVVSKLTFGANGLNTSLPVGQLPALPGPVVTMQPAGTAANLFPKITPRPVASPPTGTQHIADPAASSSSPLPLGTSGFNAPMLGLVLLALAIAIAVPLLSVRRGKAPGKGHSGQVTGK